ncbi:MAG: hypothetical protein GAK35_03039 [Herbaspirillum frisingense]|uniref:Uncharacterized protein n=1 Tax=Herbaspirillum frisingense TaxID=92645 RepID=A0A7V8FUZ0_9BURK|nr:MAG: hypothetical protein GAK35_03039 [Herbaspirillum frisingense]
MNAGQAMENNGSCEGTYKSVADGKIYQYKATYQGAESVAWTASVNWGQTQALSRVGSISHNMLSGHSLQELVRAHVIAAIQSALGERIA